MKTPTVAFQGELGAYSHEAAERFFRGQLQPIPQRSFEDVFRAVETEEADLGIVPIENSLVGSIHRNYDLLLISSLQVIAEQDLRIEHALIGLPGSKLEQIREVSSHPVALEQCRDYLSAQKLTQRAAYDTAGAVKALQGTGDPAIAAVASRYAAELYGMKILAAAIQDETDNYTRFLILSRDRAERCENCKTSIVFALKNVPGALFKALSVFALRDLDLTKIESRPVRSRKWQYYFYLDFQGHAEDDTARNAINHLGEITSFLKILGSYPAQQSE
ncbi:MAG: prephenate dehydratase [bacterium]